MHGRDLIPSCLVCSNQMVRVAIVWFPKVTTQVVEARVKLLDLTALRYLQSFGVRMPWSFKVCSHPH